MGYSRRTVEWARILSRLTRLNPVRALADDDRVHAIAEADYREGSGAYRWIMRSLEQMATLIGIDRDRALRDRVHPSGGM